MDFTARSYQKELLDRKDIPFSDIRRNMDELNTINTLLGGHAITVAGFAGLAAKRSGLTVCEIGCGGGDNLRAISRYCKSRHMSVDFLGIDINPGCVEVAKSKSTESNFRFAVSDYREYNFNGGKPDIIFSSLFCHHFSEPELTGMLRWMHVNSKKGFFINDLHRHYLAYHSIKMLTAAFSRSYLVKNDAPLSVLRGFSRKEWIELLHQSSITNYTIQWKWAFRWLIRVRTN